MKLRKLLVRSGLALLGGALCLLGASLLAFYALFYFPNRGTALRQSLVTSGVARDYLLYLPPNYDPARPTPLVISLHAAMSWPSSQMHFSQWNRVADRHGFLVVYPAGTGTGPKTWFMEGREDPAHMPDILFLSALIDRLEATYPIDRRRIYVDGLSNGGGMAFMLACVRSDRIAAVGMISAARSVDWDWHPGSRPVPMIAFHGTADPVAPFRGGRTPVGPDVFPGVGAFTAAWARRHGCAAEPTETRIAPDATRLDYRDPGGEVRVALYTLEGGGHQWPGGAPLPAWLVGPDRRSLDATSLLWDFYDSHPLPAAP